jgi:hypothetical protein
MERFKGEQICCLWCVLLTPIFKNRILRGIFGLIVEEVIGCCVLLQEHLHHQNDLLYILSCNNGIWHWGGGGGNLIDSKKNFPQQKGIVSIMTCLSSRTSCKLLFINLVFAIHTIPDEVLVTEFGNIHI